MCEKSSEQECIPFWQIVVSFRMLAETLSKENVSIEARWMDLRTLKEVVHSNMVNIKLGQV